MWPDFADFGRAATAAIRKRCNINLQSPITAGWYPKNEYVQQGRFPAAGYRAPPSRERPTNGDFLEPNSPDKHGVSKRTLGNEFQNAFESLSAEGSDAAPKEG